MKNLSESLAMLGLITGVIIIVFIIAKYTYLIKKAMIENGGVNMQANNKIKYIDIGCIVTGLGLGFIVSSVFAEMDINEGTADLLIWGTISIFGGISLIVAHFMRRRFEK